MNVSYRWLRALAPGIEDSPEELADRLAMLGAPVEELVRVGEGLAEIRVARVRRVREHPDADRLVLCDVDAGGEVVQVVCGAPNVAEGRYYPYVGPGQTLPDGTEITEAEIRGEASRGMLLSERELGLGPDHSGLLELRGEFETGRPLLEAVALDDHRLVLEITPNRPDLLSHVGVAREVAPSGDAGVALPPFPEGVRTELELAPADDGGEVAGIPVTIDDPELCPRYAAAVIRGVEVGPSPAWLASRLRAVGARPINNVVDATNYILHEMGQPLHAFDVDELAGPEIIVRRAREGESLVTLDGVERELGTEMLAICDGGGPVAVAGVMGGADSEVSAETTDVLLECALFDPKSVRATARALGLSTDASYRFERGVDPEGQPAALRRLVDLVVAVAGGTPEGPAVDVHPRPPSATTVEVRPERVRHVLGIGIDAGGIREALEPLGFSVEPREGEGPLRVTVPGWRSRDVTREIDLIEEVARRHGYDRFPEELTHFRPGTVPDHPLFEVEDEIRASLAAEGILEALETAFAPEGEGEVALVNPVSADETRLRGDVLPGLLRSVEHNFSRGTRDVRLFEIGTVFHRSPSDVPPVEEPRAAVALTGRRRPHHWTGDPGDVDLWDVKALARRLLEVARIPGGRLEEGAPDVELFEPDLGYTLVGDDGPVGIAGRIRDDAVDAPPWAGAVWGLEIRLPPEPGPRREPGFRALPDFPGVDRDVAAVVRDEVSAEEVRAAVEGAGGTLLEAVELFDVFRGEGIADGARSLAFRLRFRSEEGTLTDREVETAMERIVTRLEEELDVDIRGR